MGFDNTILQIVLLYGSEIQSFTKASVRKLINVENKFLRNIVGPIKEGDFLRIRKKKELRDSYKDPDTIAFIISHRLRWLGHVYRMVKRYLSKNLTEDDFYEDQD